MAPTPDITYQLAVLFFNKRELYPDPSTRGLLPYLPPHAILHIRWVRNLSQFFYFLS